MYHFCIAVIIDSILCFLSFLFHLLLGFYIAYIIIVSNYMVFIYICVLEDSPYFKIYFLE